MNYQQIFAFIRYAINPERTTQINLNMINWAELFQFSCEQAIAGVVFNGIVNLNGKDVDIPFDILMNWIGYSEQIKNHNRLLNRKSAEIVEEYQKAGYSCCILKGQGNAWLYPNNLIRNTGDIDLLIRDADRHKILKFLKKKGKAIEGMHFQHIEYEEDGIPIEIHLLPCSDNNPIYHHRLQHWFVVNSPGIWNNFVDLPEGVGSISIPDVHYNLIYQLAHMKGHFFDEGIGLRQMMDYYFLLKKNGRCQTEDISRTLKYLGLWKFAGAVMYIMQEVFELDEKYLLAPVNKRRGKMLMTEMLKGGNFGHYSGLSDHGTVVKYVLKCKRSMSFVREFPSEALCEPFFRTWHFMWRLANRGEQL